EKVWRYLTEAELRQQWFMGGTDATGVGEFELLVDHDKLSSEQVPYPESYELFADGDRTRLVLTHSGIESPSGFQDFGGGWTSHLAVLQEKLAGRSVKDFWALHAKSREAVRQALES